MQQLLPAQQIYDYVRQRLRHHLQINKRQLASAKIAHDQIVQQTKHANKYVQFGLKRAIDDASQPQNKRKHIEQSPYLQMLTIATRQWGNEEYHAQLQASFEALAQFEYDQQFKKKKE